MTRRDAGQALLLLTVTIGAAVGWAWWDDKPQASAGLSLLHALVATALLKGHAGAMVGLACTYGLGYLASALACVVWFPHLSSTEIGVCDEGTGAPVGLLYCVGALLVAAELLATRGRS